MLQYQYIQSKLLGLGFIALDHGIINFAALFPGMIQVTAPGKLA